MTATGSRPTATDAKDRLDGADLVAMFTAAAAALQRNIEPINNLNVFPVPDGDTGTNMYLTMQSGIDDLGGLTAPTVSDVASAFYSGTFMGARGNSGVILSQFFKGFSEGLEGRTDCRRRRPRSCLRSGKAARLQISGESRRRDHAHRHRLRCRGDP